MLKSTRLNNQVKSKQRSLRLQENRTYTGKHIDLLQEKLNEDPRTSTRKNGLKISESICNRTTKRDLK